MPPIVTATLPPLDGLRARIYECLRARPQEPHDATNDVMAEILPIVDALAAVNCLHQPRRRDHPEMQTADVWCVECKQNWPCVTALVMREVEE